MRQIISSNKNKTIDILDFDPTFTDEWYDVFIKPIGIFDNREKEKSFFIQSVFGGDKVDHISTKRLEHGNSYNRGIKINELKEYIKSRVEHDYSHVYVFDNSAELIEWLAFKVF